MNTEQTEVATKALSIDQIVQADDLKTKTVECPEWGGHVVIKVISKAEQNKVRLSLIGKDGNSENMSAFEQNLFTSSMVEPSINDQQYILLQEKSALVIERILKEIIDLNGMGADEDKKLDAQFQEG